MAEARRKGIHTSLLTRMVREGTIERLGRGQYRIARDVITEHHGLVLASAVVPDGVICLLSALSFHEIGTQLHAQIWVARRRGRPLRRVDRTRDPPRRPRAAPATARPSG